MNKKNVSVLLGILLALLVAIPAFAAAPDYTFGSATALLTLDAGGKACIAVDGYADQDSPVLIVLYQPGILPTLAEEHVANMIYASVDASGRFSEAFPLDELSEEGYGSGGYTMTVDYVRAGVAQHVVFDPFDFLHKEDAGRSAAEQAVAGALTDVDTLTAFVGTHGRNMLLDPALVTLFLENNIVKQAVYAQLVQAGGTVENFKPVFDRCCAAYAIKLCNEKDVGQQITKYFSLFNADIGLILQNSDLWEAMCKKVQTLEITSAKDMQSALEMLVYVTAAEQAENWGALNRVLLEDYADVFSLNLDRYATVQNKSNVFSTLLQGKPYLSVADICSKFQDAVAAELAAQSDGTGGQIGSLGKGTGGSIGGGAGGVTYETTPIQPAMHDGFTDMQTHWAKETVAEMATKKLVTGFGDGSFRPDQTITRAEFVTIVARAFGLDDFTAYDAFSDVRSTDWYYPYVMAAKNAELVNGKSANVFGSMDLITREQLAAILYRAALRSNYAFNATRQENAFVDFEQVAEYARESVEKLSGDGIIAGYDDHTFSPQKNATRAEAAVMISRVLKLVQ